jgi:hypothetical protein
MAEQDPDQMADVTRRLAREAAPEEGDKAGSHGFPAREGSGDGPLGQQGTGQSDDVHGQSPAAGMARQHANPANQRDATRERAEREGTDDETARAPDVSAGRASDPRPCPS